MDEIEMEQSGSIEIMNEFEMQQNTPISPESRALVHDATVKETQLRRRLEFEKDDEFNDFVMDDESQNCIHSKIPKEMVPKLGMEFETENEAYEFYNAYALEVGFCVHRSKSHSDGGKILDRNFVCSCEGKRGPDKRDDVYKSHRSETRFGCLAMLKISCRQTCNYRVVKFVFEHTHNLASPSKAHLFRSHRKISNSQKSEVDMAEISGIAPKNVFDFMSKQAGGRESLGFAHVDVKNYLRTKRSLQMKSGDTGGVLEYLQSMQMEDPNFFYAIQVDQDDLITNIFLADAKMMLDYDYFGDVVCFDTTYRKHKDGRPIALFVGVNHHKQTIIFGSALLYDETTYSFIWLFDTFARAMGGKLPKTMLTDQDAAMSKALASQWPQTYHRLCIWHIFQNAATHLSKVFEKFKDFSTDFSNCVYDHEYEEVFLDAWRKMLHKYDLESNDWLKRMFSIKEKWALDYGRDTFCADMISTQRSESMNKLIKNYISYKHNLRSFFEHFQELLSDRRYQELVADFKADQSKVVLSFPVEILKHASSVYTPKVFTLFQAEVCKSYDCSAEICDETGASTKYVAKRHNKNYNFVVSYDATEEETISCSCRKFEFAGILCCHILQTFSRRGIVKVPEKYILKRWTKDVKKGISRVNGESSNNFTPKEMMGRRYRDLCRISTRLVTRAAESEEAYIAVKEGLVNLVRELDLKSAKNPSQCSFMGNNEGGGDPSLNKDLCINVMEKTIKGVKVKPKSGNWASKRPKGALGKVGKCKRGKKKIVCDKNMQIPMAEQNEQVTVHSHPTHLTQCSFSEASILHQDEIQFSKEVHSQINSLNAFTQQGSLLPLLQHSQLDDIQAYAQLLQSSEI